jgi:hypothetical protein
MPSVSLIPSALERSRAPQDGQGAAGTLAYRASGIVVLKPLRAS